MTSKTEIARFATEVEAAAFIKTHSLTLAWPHKTFLSGRGSHYIVCAHMSGTVHAVTTNILAVPLYGW